jgi:repressor LexA
MAMADPLAGKRREILNYIEAHTLENGYPPSVREICQAVGLKSTSTVHAHIKMLEREGYLERNPTKPRALVLNYESTSGAQVPVGKVRHVPVVGNVAAGTGVLAVEQVEEVMALPEELAGHGTVFMLHVRGDSMIEAGIFDGDLVVVRQQPDAQNGDIVVATIPGEEGTVKRLRHDAKRHDVIVLEPANPAYEPIILGPEDVTIHGKVVALLRKL